MVVYSWKYNQAVSAEIAGKRFEELQAKHGEITPKIVLDDARGVKSPLHHCFEWDDGKAAEQYRLQQAGLMIRALVVTVEDAEIPKPTRAFVNVADVSEKQGRFIAISTALSKEETKRAVLARAMLELSQFRAKYEDLQELVDVFAAVDKLTRKQKKKEKAA